MDNSITRATEQPYDRSVTIDRVVLKTLKPFDTLFVSTEHSVYRIFLLDPQTGRVLIEGGKGFIEPIEAMISGATSGNWLVNNRSIGIGMGIEIWLGNKLIATSPVRSIRLEPNHDHI